MRGTGSGSIKAEQNQPCEAVHSARFDEDLQQATVSRPTFADYGTASKTSETVETLCSFHGDTECAGTRTSGKSASDKYK